MNSRARVADPDIGGAAAGIADVFTALFTTMDGWRAALAEQDWPSTGPTPGALDALTRSLVEPELSRTHPTVVGAGFVACPGWLPAAPWYLSWWLGGSNSVGLLEAGRKAVEGPPAIRRLAADLDPGSESFRDYTTLEWWRVPVGTGRPHITGPYVDYLCTDDHTLTLTAPVQVRGGLIGVVGVDIYVKTVEAIVLPQLRRLGRRATVINGAGRILVSTDPHRAAGVVLRLDGLRELLASSNPSGDLPGGRTVHPCPGTVLRVLLE